MGYQRERTSLTQPGESCGRLVKQVLLATTGLARGSAILELANLRLFAERSSRISLRKSASHQV